MTKDAHVMEAVLRFGSAQTSEPKELEEAWPQLTELKAHLDGAGLPVMELRILEVLVWMWVDPLRQYIKRFDLPAAIGDV